MRPGVGNRAGDQDRFELRLRPGLRRRTGGRPWFRPRRVAVRAQVRAIEAHAVADPIGFRVEHPAAAFALTDAIRSLPDGLPVAELRAEHPAGCRDFGGLPVAARPAVMTRQRQAGQSGVRARLRGQLYVIGQPDDPERIGQADAGLPERASGA